MSKKPRLKKIELDFLCQAEIECRIGTGNSIGGGKAQTILEKYNDLISQGSQAEARSISKSTVEHKLAEWRRDGKIPAAAANLPTEEQPLDSEKSCPLDQPWCVGCLAKYDIPPEALPIIMWFYEKYLREEEQHFSIREALWLARLYKLIDDPIILARFAYAYKLRDQIDWILGTYTSRRDLDIQLIDYCFNKQSRAEYYRSPGSVNLVPPLGEEGTEQLRNKLEKKGYILDQSKRKTEGNHERPYNQTVQE